eukprot:scaffold329072_cov25-Prasinocladus_malaysianus.AAC.1
MDERARAAKASSAGSHAWARCMSSRPKASIVPLAGSPVAGGIRERHRMVCIKSSEDMVGARGTQLWAREASVWE